MFVLMGLSAVVPVIHGLQKYGYAQLEKQMGLSYVVAQGVLYITGAAIYAVSNLPSTLLVGHMLTMYRDEYRSDLALEVSTSGAVHIRSFTSWS
jgi:predicted membrane channel-forming protein YqfA (hemolysin III family)